jgi:hypothetical protein
MDQRKFEPDGEVYWLVAHPYTHRAGEAHLRGPIRALCTSAVICWSGMEPPRAFPPPQRPAPFRKLPDAASYFCSTTD